MRPLAPLSALLVLFATSALAQQIPVRSGEHGDFSRLVFMYPAGTAWSVEPVEGGYRLSTINSAFRYDLGSVFEYIPKSRITAVRPEVDGNALIISTGTAVHAESFQLANGALVLDVIDGAETPAPNQTLTEGPSFVPVIQDSYLNLYWQKTALPTRSDTTGGTDPAPVASPPLATTLSVPDPRVAAAEAALLDQLGRAASQGLLTLDLPRKNETDPVEHATSAPANAPGHESDGTLALNAETVIDRDMASTWSSTQITSAGHSCPSDDSFDLQAWLSDGDPADQIAAGRRNLLGEFDTPLPENVLKLARTYLALGFGIETKALLRELPIRSDEAGNLEFIANVIEDTPFDAAQQAGAMMACDSKVALWAFIAAPAPVTKTDVNFGAVLRAFSALPPNIREILGPRLSERLIATGAPDLATTVRATLARAPVEHGAALEMVDVQLELSKGEANAAAEQLTKLAQSSSEVAAEALVLAIETRLSQGEAISQGDVENAGALALQLSGSDIGEKLGRAEILGLASTGQFEEAFNRYEKWRNSAQEALVQQTRDDLLGLLARVPDDRIFLTNYFANQDVARANSAEPLVAETQIMLANRLSDLGFGSAAASQLSQSVRQSEAGRLALARSALSQNDGAAALSYLDALPGADASTLRGEALRLLGHHDHAESQFALAGNTQQQVSEAWRSGDWDFVKANGSELQKAFLQNFTSASPPTTATGPLQEAAQLLKQSEAERKAFEDLMRSLATN